jgi:hypothetical protein
MAHTQRFGIERLEAPVFGEVQLSVDFEYVAFNSNLEAILVDPRHLDFYQDFGNCSILLDPLYDVEHGFCGCPAQHSLDLVPRSWLAAVAAGSMRSCQGVFERPRGGEIAYLCPALSSG